MNKSFLVIGAHNDECEYALGGITALLTAKGWTAHYVCTSGLWHKPDCTEEDVLRWTAEEQKAANLLGASKEVLGDRTRNLSEDGEELRLLLEKIILEKKPDIVCIHWPEDNHIEHRISAKAAYDALCIAKVHGAKINEIYAFEAGPDQSRVYFVPEIFIKTDCVSDKVKESLMQFHQPTAGGEFLWREKSVHQQYRGHLAGSTAAECLKIIKFPDGNNDFYLKQELSEHFRWAGNGMYPAKGKVYF